MKVQVTECQFIETDDIVFAQQDPDSDSQTLVYIRRSEGHFTVYVGYDEFVDKLNQAARTSSTQFIRTS